MSKLEELLETLSDEDVAYLEKNVFTNDGVITMKELDNLIDTEESLRSQNDAIQYALKINLNSVYGVQIMPFFKFADEWQALGASTTLTGRILTKYGLIESIEQYFNPEREVRWEFPLLDNVMIAADDDEFFKNKFTQKLRAAVISDTDSVVGHTVIDTKEYGKMTIEEIEIHATRKEHKDNKLFWFFDNGLHVKNIIDNKEIYDTVDFIYAHLTDKQIYEIELEDGKNVQVTEDHAIMVYNENGELVEKTPLELTSEDVCCVIS